MGNRLSKTALELGTQSITGISTTLNSSDTEVPTNFAVIKYMISQMISQGLLSKVGGIVYYINTSSTNTYTFYDANGNVVSAPSVGSDYTNYYYSKSGSGVDKYYVYNTSAMFPRNRNGSELNPYIIWSYVSAGNQSFIDNTTYNSNLPSGKQEYEYYGHGGRVFETISTGDAIGTGKTNTLNMMSLRGGVYIQGAERRAGIGTWCETIWNICDLYNKGLYSVNNSVMSNTTGCNDWYIPSADELEEMKKHIGASTFVGLLCPYASGYHVVAYSSSAWSISSAFCWRGRKGYTTDIMDTQLRVDNTGTSAGNDQTFALALTRSF